MTIEITRTYALDDIGSYLLDSFLEDDDTVNFDEGIYFSDLDHFQQVEVLKAIKEQFNNAVDGAIKDIKKGDM